MPGSSAPAVFVLVAKYLPILIENQCDCVGSWLRSSSGFQSLFQKVHETVSGRMGPQGARETRTGEESAEPMTRPGRFDGNHQVLSVHILSLSANLFPLHLAWRGDRLSARSQ